MKISKEQRILNIISKALENGFEFDEQETLEDIRVEAEDFLIDNTEHVLEECPVEGSGSDQSVSWSDEFGYNFESWGEIVDFSSYWHEDADEKVLHEIVIDSKGQVIQLYYLVGETELNKSL